MKRVFDHKFSSFLFCFLLMHAVSSAFIVFVPVSARYPNPIFLFLLMLTFISFFVFGCIFLYFLSNEFVSSNMYVMKPSVVQLNFNVKLCSILSILGFLMVFYDRVFIRGIDYSQGLRVARYIWLESGSGSLLSVFGNLIIPFAYVSLFILLTQSRNLIKSQKLILVIGSFLGIVGHAALNGGRSNILIALFIAFFCIIVRDRTIQSSRSNRLFEFLIMIFLISFVLYMTSLSAKMAGISYKELSVLGIDNLYGSIDENYDSIGGFFGETGYLITYVFAYLFHGAWTAESLPFIEDHQKLEGSYLLFSFSVILREIGVLSQSISPGYFSEHGAFISLPGALYYDVGLIGVAVLSSMLGAVVGFGMALIKNRRAGVFVIGATMYVVVIALMSPILPAYGLMYLNFVFFVFVIFSIINRLKYKCSNYWL
ncbi:MAG: O-antigen polymerase [Nitrincola lacisaponensis]|uniref:O-antigen polymerase n=1 Tax=Nitrincola lacisaponensis TaxID=267850 RepID=UPI00391A54BF